MRDDMLKRTIEARDHLAALAAAHGLGFHLENERVVMVGLDGKVVSADDLGWHHGEPIKDFMGDDPVTFFERMAQREEMEAERAKGNGETIGPRISARRVAWYKYAVDLVKRDRDTT